MRRVNPSYMIRTWERSRFTTTVLKMAKTRTITATFEDGTTIQRTTNRVYTHAVKTGDSNISWCGRPDLMLKAKAKMGQPRWVGTEHEYTPTVHVAKVTNDPWNFQKLH